MSLDERGQVTAFVVAVVLALFVMGGLVIDGGYTLAARRRAIDEANEAARAGAQAVDAAQYRATGILTLDPAAAVVAAEAHLRATGHAGAVTVAGDRVQVRAGITQPTALLQIVGIRDLTVSGQGAARIVSGIGGPAP